VLYLVVRLAVRHGIEDAWRHRSHRLSADKGAVEPTRPGGFTAGLYWFLRAFGWLQ
jgi:hypothetical protein